MWLKFHVRPDCPKLKEDKPVERTNKQNKADNKADNKNTDNANAIGSGL